MQRRRRLVKAVALTVAIVVVVWVLFTLVFPWVDRQLNDPVLSVGIGAPEPVVVAESAWR